ncbi:MAG: preprotein translocase subunit SecE [Trueperaceae bacterium]
MKGLLEYLRNSRAELSRVTWPTRNEVIQATQATIFFVLLTALFLLVADLVLGNGIRGLLRIFQG